MFTADFIRPGVLHLQFDSARELATYFLRAQEYYESPKFKGEAFTIDEYAEWYAQENGGFSYYDDWSGFNVPAESILELHSRIPDWRHQDWFMHGMAQVAKSTAPEGRGYLIGTSTEKDYVLRHEIAHALYHVSSEYRQKADELIQGLDPEFREALTDWLRETGYHPSVFDDETQAYLSEAETNPDPRKWPQVATDEHCKPFRALLEPYLP
jgi:hypothetical protein